jgi:hypothetical protein
MVLVWIGDAIIGLDVSDTVLDREWLSVVLLDRQWLRVVLLEWVCVRLDPEL